MTAIYPLSIHRRIEQKWAERLKSARPNQTKDGPVEAGRSERNTPESIQVSSRTVLNLRQVDGAVA